MRRLRRGLFLAASAAALLLAAAKAPEAHSGLAAAPQLTILGARADRPAGTLTIQGQGFGSGTPAPEVSLGGTPLVVSSATPDTIVAELPSGVAHGSLLLTVTLSQGHRSDRFAVNIPDTDIVTPDGITIQSTGSDVRILAGTSRITVDPSGGIRIESDGPLDVRTPGALDLRGRTVNIAAETTLTLMSGSTINLNAAATADIRGGARVAVTGGLVTLN